MIVHLARNVTPVVFSVLGDKLNVTDITKDFFVDLVVEHVLASYALSYWNYVDLLCRVEHQEAFVGVKEHILGSLDF